MHTQTTSKLKVFVDAADLSETPLKTPFLYPLLGLPDWSKFAVGPIKKDVFDTYTANGKNHIEFAALPDCDYIVFPYNYPATLTDAQVVSRIPIYAEHAKSSGKPVLLFYGSDPEVNRLLTEIPFKDCIIFANSIFRTGQPAYVHSQPAFIKDPIRGYDNQLLIKPKPAKPVVGFCGFAAPLGIAWNKHRLQEEVRLLLYRFNLLERFKIDSFHAPRALVLKKLLRSNRVETNFILRGHSAFHSAKGILANEEKAYIDNFRKQYFDNIVHSNYVLCARGNGNFSYRLYETLALGRIPVFIDTDCALPFQDQIDWQKYCVWVEEKNISRLDKLIQDFHNQFTPLQFEQLQRDCRKLWEDFLTPEGFFLNLLSQLRSELVPSYTVST